MGTERFALMHDLVASPPFDLPLPAWKELYEAVREFAPDLILELGRGWGNSTCVFTEAANETGARVVSIGFDSEHAWETRTAPRLLPHVGEAWFAPLSAMQADITEIDYRPIVASSKGAFIFWDAHGTDVARAVLDRLLPELPPRNLVVVDDIWDAKAESPLPAEYFAGPLASLFEEVGPLWEYLSENGIDFDVGDRWVSFAAPSEEKRDGSVLRRVRVRIHRLLGRQH